MANTDDENARGGAGSAGAGRDKADGKEAAPKASRDGLHVQVAHDRLRERILAGEMPAGKTFSQVDLADQLNVGRTPLREALRILREEGLLSSEGRRVKVAEFSAEDIEEVYVLRLLIETAAIGMTVPELEPEEVAELWGLLAQISHYVDHHDFERVEIPHRAFHMALVAKSGARTVRQIEQLSDHAERYRRIYLSLEKSSFETSTEEHLTLYEAAVAGDGAEAVRRLAAHYARTATSLIKRFDPEYSPDRLEAARVMAEGHAGAFAT